MLLELEFAETYIFNALYSFTITGVVMIMIVTHVDDILWAREPENEHVIGSLKKRLKMRSEEQTNFRYCGVETVKVTCQQTSLNLGLINVSAKELSKLNRT